MRKALAPDPEVVELLLLGAQCSIDWLVRDTRKLSIREHLERVRSLRDQLLTIEEKLLSQYAGIAANETKQKVETADKLPTAADPQPESPSASPGARSCPYILQPRGEE